MYRERRYLARCVVQNLASCWLRADALAHCEGES